MLLTLCLLVWLDHLPWAKPKVDFEIRYRITYQWEGARDEVIFEWFKGKGERI